MNKEPNSVIARTKKRAKRPEKYWVVMERGKPILDEARLPIYYRKGAAKQRAQTWSTAAVVVEVILYPIHP